MLNRRHFLAGCAGAALVAPLLPALPWRGASGPAPAAPGAPLAGEPALVPARTTFSAILGERFEVFDGEDGRPLGQIVLSRLEDQANSCERVEQFMLGFDGLGETPLGSGIYTLRHRQAGIASLRLEPLAAAGESPRYQAAFALLRDTV